MKSNEELGKKLIKINDLSTSLAIIIGEKNELKRNQEELGLEVTDFEDIDTYENNFKNIESLYEEKKKGNSIFYKKPGKNSLIWSTLKKQNGTSRPSPRK